MKLISFIIIIFMIFVSIQGVVFSCTQGEGQTHRKVLIENERSEKNCRTSNSNGISILSFKALGYKGACNENVYLQVFVVGNKNPIFEDKIGNPDIGTIKKPYWSNPLNITLPASYENEPIAFRITGCSSKACPWRVFISNIRLTIDGKIMNVGEWNYKETTSGFQGFIGNDNILLEHPAYGGDGTGYAEFVSETVINSPDLKISYNDVTLLDSTGNSIHNYDVLPGQDIILRTKIHNLGGSEVDTVTSGIYYFNWSAIEEKRISIPSGSVTTVDFNWTFPNPQKSTLIRIAVDYGNAYNECNEHNNHINKIITGQHPYLFFYGYEMDSLKDKINDESSKVRGWWNQVKANADKALNYDFKDRNIHDLKRTFTSAELAFTYLMTDNPAYAVQAKEALLYLNPYLLEDQNGVYQGGRAFAWAFDFLFSHLKDHDYEDLNGNGISDLLEIQQNLAALAIITYTGSGACLSSACHRPPGFPEGPSPQERGKIASQIGPLAFSLIGFNEILKGINENKTINVSFESPEDLVNFISNDMFGYPDPSDWGNSVYYNPWNIHSQLGIMLGPDGMYQEGTYYWGTSYWRSGFAGLMQIMNNMGIDVQNIPYIKQIPDFFIKTMAPDRTMPIYYTGHRQEFLSMLEMVPLFNESKELYMWYSNETDLVSYSEIQCIIQILSYNRNIIAISPETYFERPSQSLSDVGLAVLRSDWSEDATYMMVLGEHNNNGLNTSHSEGDATSFNLYAKGEYLILEGGDGRFADGRIVLEGGDYGWHDDNESWIKPWGNLSVDKCDHEWIVESPVGHNLILVDNNTRFGCKNVPGHLQSYRYGIDKAYIENFLATDSMDYLDVRVHEGDLHDCINEISNVDIDNTRSIIFPNHEYFILIDDLKSLNNEPHIYGFQLHFAGAHVETNTEARYASWYGNDTWKLKKMDGSLKADGSLVIWDDAEEDVLTGCKELIWKTKNSDDEEIALITYFITPDVDIYVDRGDGDDYNTRYLDPYINPYVKACANGTDIKFLTFLYPWKLDCETAPEIVDLTAIGGQGGKLDIGTRKDLIVIKNDLSKEVIAEDIRTDAKIAFSSYDDNLNFYFIKDGSFFNYYGQDELRVSQNVEILTHEYNINNRTFSVKGEGIDVEITILGITQNLSYEVTRNNEIYDKWVFNENVSELTITTDLNGFTTFNITEIPSPPQNLKATAGDEQIILTWSPPKYNAGFEITNYTIYRGNISGELKSIITIGNILTYTDTNLINGVTYHYKITAFNGIKKSPFSFEINATPLGRPSEPILLQAVTGDCFVNLSWAKPLDNGGDPLILYNIYRGESKSSLLKIKEHIDKNWINDTTVTNGRTYYYAVSAVNDMGEGPLSNYTQVTLVDKNIPHDDNLMDLLFNPPYLISIIAIVVTIVLFLVFKRRCRWEIKEFEKSKKSKLDELEE
ncbi:MAG: fibronectin type III domain-containing protein [Thermoplasmata archaeon]|nr:MAG: fibronectin type III domain-containing protein [Thermoplasmata archaeon]